MRKLIGALACGLMAGCLGDPVGPGGAGSRLAFTLHTMEFDALGDTASLKINVVSGPAVVLGGRGIGFASDNPAVVQVVSEDGKVAIVGNGRAVVRATLPAATPDSVLIVVQQRARTISGMTGAGARLASLGDTVSLRPVARDRNGALVAGAAFRFTSSDSATLAVSATGTVTALSNGTSTVTASVDSVSASTIVTVSQVAGRVADLPDSLHFATLGRSVQLQPVALDRNNRIVVGAAFGVVSSDSTVVRVTRGGQITAVHNGQASVTLTIDSVEAVVPVRVAQLGVAVVVAPTALHFASLGLQQPFEATVTDSGGAPVQAGPVQSLGLSDSSVAQVSSPTSIRSVGNGTAVYRFQVGGVSGSIAVQVHQVAVELTAAGVAQDSILRPPLGSPLQVACTGVDSAGIAVAPSLISVRSVNGTVSGASCASLTVAHSGTDTLIMLSGSAVTRLPIRLAVQATVSSAAGQFLAMDSVPRGGDLWAASADTAPGGAVELRIADYMFDSSANENLADLVRFTSVDGVSFTYDTTLVQHGDTLDASDGRGVENSVIFPAANGAGWRMLYGGGNDLSGWGTYSASSMDRRHWVKTGVVIPNGYPGEVNPSGEGLQVDRLPDGTWRLINGAYDPTPAGVNTFSITEWLSTDQAHWVFVRTLVSVLDAPPGASRAVYAPCLRQIGPSMWRLIFTGDNWQFVNGQIVSGSSAIWSAVSSDLIHWQQEGQLLGQSGSDLFYSTLAGTRLYFLRRDTGARARVATVTLAMP